MKKRTKRLGLSGKAAEGRSWCDLQRMAALNLSRREEDVNLALKRHWASEEGGSQAAGKASLWKEVGRMSGRVGPRSHGLECQVQEFDFILQLMRISALKCVEHERKRVFGGRFMF